MSDLPRLSIIMPAYNAGSTIGQAIASTFALLDLGAELVIADDGSSDDTLRVALSFAEKYPSIKVLAQSNAGPSKARRAAFKASTGGFVTFLDADDLLDPIVMVAAWKAAVRSGSPISKTLIAEFSQEPDLVLHMLKAGMTGPVKSEYRMGRTDSWLIQAWGGFVGAVYARDLIEQVLPMVGDLVFGEDLVFTFALTVNEPAFAQISIIGYWYRTKQESQATAPASLKRLEITEAFRTCESIAISYGASQRALFWLLIQRYRWSRSRSVATELRPLYRSTITAYSRGLRRRLCLSQSELLIQSLKIVGTYALRERFRGHRHAIVRALRSVNSSPGL